jgi:hypothetical protein
MWLRDIRISSRLIKRCTLQSRVVKLGHEDCCIGWCRLSYSCSGQRELRQPLWWLRGSGGNPRKTSQECKRQAVNLQCGFIELGFSKNMFVGSAYVNWFMHKCRSCITVLWNATGFSRRILPWPMTLQPTNCMCSWLEIYPGQRESSSSMFQTLQFSRADYWVFMGCWIMSTATSCTACFCSHRPDLAKFYRMLEWQIQIWEKKMW